MLIEVVQVVGHFGEGPTEVAREVKTEEHEGRGPAETHGTDMRVIKFTKHKTTNSYCPRPKQTTPEHLHFDWKSNTFLK